MSTEFDHLPVAKLLCHVFGKLCFRHRPITWMLIISSVRHEKIHMEISHYPPSLTHNSSLHTPSICFLNHVPIRLHRYAVSSGSSYKGLCERFASDTPEKKDEKAPLPQKSDHVISGNRRCEHAPGNSLYQRVVFLAPPTVIWNHL